MNASTGSPTAPSVESIQTITLDVPTYEGLNALVAASDAVVIGHVVLATDGELLSLGTDEAGEPLGSLPFTDYTVAVSEVLYGSAVPGTELIVSAPGGVVDGVMYAIEDLGDLELEVPMVFFLALHSSGGYYVLGGGHATARVTPDEPLVLPGEVVGGDPVEFVPQDVLNLNSGPVVPPPPPLPPLECAGQVVTVDLARGQSPTAGSDVIRGTSGNDVIGALGGADVICSLGGDDTVSAGGGMDRVFAGPGADSVRAGGAGGLVIGGDGDDTLIGGIGNDDLRGNAGDDSLLGRAADDVLRGGVGDDMCDGGIGNDFAHACERRLGVP